MMNRQRDKAVIASIGAYAVILAMILALAIAMALRSTSRTVTPSTADRVAARQALLQLDAATQRCWREYGRVINAVMYLHSPRDLPAIRGLARGATDHCADASRTLRAARLPAIAHVQTLTHYRDALIGLAAAASAAARRVDRIARSRASYVVVLDALFAAADEATPPGDADAIKARWERRVAAAYGL